MAKITQQKINEWNSKMANGWRISMSSLVFHDEKNPELKVNIDDKTYIEAKIWYQDVKDGYKYTGLKAPYLHLALCHKKDNDMAVSYGLGYFKCIGEPVKRASFNNLIKLTNNYTSDYIMRLYQAKASQLNNEEIL